MSIKSREELKKRFQSGKVPNQQDFHDLLESFVNMVNDCLATKQEGGVQVFREKATNWIELVGNRRENQIRWALGTSPETDCNGIGILEYPSNQENCPQVPTNRLYIHPKFGMGIGTQNPKGALDVHGTLAMRSRIGTFNTGEFRVPGQHNILPANFQLREKYYVAVEVIAYLTHDNCETNGVSILHCTAVGAYPRETPGASGGELNVSGSFAYNSDGGSIKIKWGGTANAPQLILSNEEAKSGVIRFYVTDLLGNGPVATISDSGK